MHTGGYFGFQEAAIWRYGDVESKNTLWVITEGLCDLNGYGYVCVRVFVWGLHCVSRECVPVSDMESYSPGGKGVSQRAS